MEIPKEGVADSKEVRLEKLITEAKDAFSIMVDEMDFLTRHQYEIHTHKSSVDSLRKIVEEKTGNITSLEVRMKELLKSLINEPDIENISDSTVIIKNLRNKISVLEQQKEGLILEYEHRVKSSFQ